MFFPCLSHVKSGDEFRTVKNGSDCTNRDKITNPSVMTMARKKKNPSIDIHQIIQNKVPNETVLRMAMDLGMISTEKFETLQKIGESKQVEELMKELSSDEQSKLIETLKKLDNDGLIEIK